MPRITGEAEKIDFLVKLSQIYEKFSSGLLTPDQAIIKGHNLIEKTNGLNPSEIQDMKTDWVFTINANNKRTFSMSK